MRPVNDRPNAGRPYIPGYGIPDTNEGLLPWSYVQERMRSSINYWICTANAKGQPHATPVWGVWVEDVFYCDGGPDTRRNRDIAVNPSVSVHLEDGTRVIILEGTIKNLKTSPIELREKVAAAYTEKYSKMGYSPTAESWKDGGLYAFRAGTVFAWTQFPEDSTRWQFEE